MSGTYFNPIKRIFLNLSGGTVTGDTFFTEGVSIDSLSANTYYSGSTELGILFNNAIKTAPYLPLSGGTGGPYLFTGGTTANTLIIEAELAPLVDNTVDLGKPARRFRQLNTVDGVAVGFTASTRVKTSVLRLGNTDVTESNIVLSGNCLNGGEW
jgi:hypothetical protein